LFWGADDTHIDVAASGYIPVLLGTTPSEAGVAVVGYSRAPRVFYCAFFCEDSHHM
jgi:hypothetical protein